MKVLKHTLLAAALAGAVGSALAGWETWTYRGPLVTDGGTRTVTKMQAGNTWDDWVWRGVWEDKVQYCHPYSRGCSFTWGTSKTQSYSHTTGWSVGGGFGFEAKAIEGEVKATFQRSKTWTESQSENFDMRSDLAPGQWAQPVIVAVRRWKSGHFNGAHFLDYNRMHGSYWYEWAWRDFGSWQGSEKEWGFKMIHVANDRSRLF